MLALHGAPEKYGSTFSLAHPDFDLLDRATASLDTGRIIPLYPGGQALEKVGLNSRTIRRKVKTLTPSVLGMTAVSLSEGTSSIGVGGGTGGSGVGVGIGVAIPFGLILGRPYSRHLYRTRATIRVPDPDRYLRNPQAWRVKLYFLHDRHGPHAVTRPAPLPAG